MPRNNFGGNKAKRAKNFTSDNKTKDVPLPKDNDSLIALVKSCCGDCRFKCDIVTKDNVKKEILVHLPRGSRRYGRVVVGSFVLISIREFEDKGDILYKYTDSDIEYLRDKKYLSSYESNQEGADIKFGSGNNDSLFSESSNNNNNNNSKKSNEEEEISNSFGMTEDDFMAI